MTTERRARFAHEIVIDGDTFSVFIDGVHFGYHLISEPAVEKVYAGTYEVQLSVLADSVILNGRPTPYDPDDPAYLARELDWAKVRGRQIVHEGMAEVLEWLDDARQRYEQEAEALANERAWLKAARLAMQWKDPQPMTEGAIQEAFEDTLAAGVELRQLRDVRRTTTLSDVNTETDTTEGDHA